MLISNIVQTKKARYDEAKTTLIEYINSLKSESLNSTHSIPPEIEDAISDQFSNLSIEESEFLLEEVIYPGILILRDHPNALIGDIISQIVSFNSMKTVLFSTKIDSTRFTPIFNVEDWYNLEPRAICMRISIILSLIESLTILNVVLPNLKNIVKLIFKGFQNETYFTQLSATKLISSLIKMKVLTSFILDEFLTYQNNLISQLKMPVSDSYKNRLQFYKYLFNDIHSRKLLFQSNIELKSDLENNSYINREKPRLEFASKFCNFIQALVFQDDIFISNQGIELFSLVLSDDSGLYSIHLQTLIKEIINSVKVFIDSFSTKKTKKNLNTFLKNLKLVNIVIGNANSKILINTNFGILALKFISLIFINYPDFNNNQEFTKSGIVSLLLKVVSSFEPYVGPNYNGKFACNKALFNSPFKLTDQEIESLFKYVDSSFQVNKLLLINLHHISSLFQLAEPQIINYSDLLLKNSVNSCTKFANSLFFNHFQLFIKEFSTIYERGNLSNWQLFLLIKYLISLYSLDLIKLIPTTLHSKIVNMILEIIFIDFNHNPSVNIKLEIKKYSLLGPNVILKCSELLNLVMKVPNLDKSLFELSFSILEELLRTCLSFKVPGGKIIKGELFHDDYVEFLIRVISIIKEVDIPICSKLVLNPEILSYISEFSKNGLSSITLDSIFIMIEIFLRKSMKDVNITTIESLVDKLLLFYIPYEQQDGYLLFYNSYRQFCKSHTRPIYLPDPVQINDEFRPLDYNSQQSHIVEEKLCIDSILGRFAECNLDCTGE